MTLEEFRLGSLHKQRRLLVEKIKKLQEELKSLDERIEERMDEVLGE